MIKLLLIAFGFVGMIGSASAEMSYECWTYLNGHPDKMTHVSANNKQEAELIHRVAREDLRIVQPMLNALRAGDKKALEKYDDLKPLQDYVDEVFNSATYQPGVVTQAVESSTSHPNESDDAVPTDSLSSLRTALSTLNISSDIAEVLVQEALIKIPSGDPLLMMSFISEKLTSVPKSKPAKSPRLKVTEDNVLQLPDKDLRKILAMAKNSGMGAYNALLGAEIIKHPMSDIAA